ncbi:MAG: hypothetical protein QOE41_472, partial [Mycobacterium sp.]|nr:hypothetical protein [Mycobacterium sp.]
LGDLQQRRAGPDGYVFTMRTDHRNTVQPVRRQSGHAATPGERSLSAAGRVSSCIGTRSTLAATVRIRMLLLDGPVNGGLGHAPSAQTGGARRVCQRPPRGPKRPASGCPETKCSRRRELSKICPSVQHASAWIFESNDRSGGAVASGRRLASTASMSSLCVNEVNCVPSARSTESSGR